jgi:hypothetical protein
MWAGGYGKIDNALKTGGLFWYNELGRILALAYIPPPSGLK